MWHIRFYSHVTKQYLHIFCTNRTTSSLQYKIKIVHIAQITLLCIQLSFSLCISMQLRVTVIFSCSHHFLGTKLLKWILSPWTSGYIMYYIVCSELSFVCRTCIAINTNNVITRYTVARSTLFLHAIGAVAHLNIRAYLFLLKSMEL